MKTVLAALLLMAVSACGDAGPTAPGSTPSAPAPSGIAAQAPLLDALERIAPTLGTGPAAIAVRSALAAAVQDASPAALDSVEAALEELQLELPDAAVEADVIRLAINAQR